MRKEQQEKQNYFGVGKLYVAKTFVSSPRPCCVIASSSACQQNLCCRSNSKGFPCDHIETRPVTVNKSITALLKPPADVYLFISSILTLLNIFTWWHQSRRWLGLTLATHSHTHAHTPPWPDFLLCVTEAPAVLPASSQQLFPAKRDEHHVKAAERRTRPHTRVVMRC